MNITTADMLNLAQNAASSIISTSQSEQMQISKNGMLYVSKKKGFLKSIYSRVVIRVGRMLGKDYETKFCLRDKKRAQDAASFFREKIKGHLVDCQTKWDIMQLEELQKQEITPSEMIKTWHKVVNAHQPIVGKVNKESLNFRRLASKKTEGQNLQTDLARVRFSNINIKLESLSEEHRDDLIELYNDYTNTKFNNNTKLILENLFNKDFAHFIPVLQQAAADHSYAKSLLDYKERSVGIHGKLVDAVGVGNLFEICDAYVDLSSLNFNIVSLLRKVTADKSVAAGDDSLDLEINTEATYKSQSRLEDSIKVDPDISRKRHVVKKKRIKPPRQQTQELNIKKTPMTPQRLAELLYDETGYLHSYAEQDSKLYGATIVAKTSDRSVSLTPAHRKKYSTLEYDFLHAVSDSAFLSLVSGSEATEDRALKFKRKIFLGSDPNGGLPLVLLVARDISTGKDEFDIFDDKLIGEDKMTTDLAQSIEPSLISGTMSSIIHSFALVDNETKNIHDLLKFCKNENYDLGSVASFSHKESVCKRIKTRLLEKP